MNILKSVSTYIIFISNILVACNSNNIENSDRERLGLINRVKRISEQTFYNTKKFGDNTKSDISEFTYNLGFPCDKREFLFNKKGQIISGTIDLGIDKLEQTCTYRNNRLIQEDFLLDSREFYSIDHNTDAITNWGPFRSVIGRNILWPIKYFTYTNWENQLDKLFKTEFKDTIVVVWKKDLGESILINNEICDMFYFNAEKELIGHGLPEFIWTFKKDVGRYEYYDDGKLKFKKYPETIERYDYSEELLIRKTIYDQDNNIEGFCEYEYDERNRIVREIYKEKSTVGYGYNLIWDESYLYGKDGKLSQIIKYSPEYGTDSTHFEYENNLLRFIQNEEYRYELIYDNYNKLLFARGSLIDTLVTIGPYEYKYEYMSVEYMSIKHVSNFDESQYSKVETEYDSNGNWVRKLCFIEDKPIVWKVREIEYY